jgi:hypothetical protein
MWKITTLLLGITVLVESSLLMTRAAHDELPLQDCTAIGELDHSVMQGFLATRQHLVALEQLLRQRNVTGSNTRDSTPETSVSSRVVRNGSTHEITQPNISLNDGLQRLNEIAMDGLITQDEFDAFATFIDSLAPTDGETVMNEFHARLRSNEITFQP